MKAINVQMMVNGNEFFFSHLQMDMWILDFKVVIFVQSIYVRFPILIVWNHEVMDIKKSIIQRSLRFLERLMSFMEN